MSASETGHHDVQPGRFAAQRQVGEPTLYLVVDPAGGTASRAPVINACQRANQDRLVGPDLLGLDPQTQDIDPGERGQIRDSDRRAHRQR